MNAPPPRLPAASRSRQLPRLSAALKEATKHVFILLILAFAFFPLFVMLVVSLKDNQQYAAKPWFFDHPADWHWENWVNAWATVHGYIANSFFTALTGTGIALVLTVLTSYVLARRSFPGRDLLYYLIMGSMFLPGTVAALVTLFDLLQRLHLLNSLWALILVGSAGGQIFGIYIVKQFIDDLPVALFEAADLEGASHFRQITEIVLPMSAPILATVALLQFMTIWNEVILPMLILRDTSKLTLTVGLTRMEGEYVKNWGELMAGYAIGALPLIVLFFFMNRMFLRGAGLSATVGDCVEGQLPPAAV